MGAAAVWLCAQAPGIVCVTTGDRTLVLRAYKALKSGTPIFALNSQPAQPPRHGSSDSDTEGIFEEPEFPKPA